MIVAIDYGIVMTKGIPLQPILVPMILSNDRKEQLDNIIGCLSTFKLTGEPTFYLRALKYIEALGNDLIGDD